MTPRPPTPPATVLAWSGIFVDPALAALLALDAQLGEIVRTTTTPLVGQMRLTWWDEALRRLDTAPAPAQPILRALQAEVLPRGVAGGELAAMIDGWDLLIGDEAPDAAALARYAEARGATLLAAMAQVTGNAGAVSAAGRRWALADLAGHVADPGLGGEAARAALAQEVGPAPRLARGLARDAALAARGQGEPGSPRRAAAVLRAVLTGR